ncbi:efflux RND transporter periplasmic adaptor subunit [Pseudodesulfovibrio senegalensis]|nr:efflux RND transporter periplasmic adaptor subunit [Pseudodesulfovibrio senegalensis]
MRMNTLWLVAVLIAVPLVAGCVGGDDQASANQPAAEKAPAAPASAKAPASTETFAVRKAARRAILTAFTRARSRMTLVSEVSARVEDVQADVGDTLGKDGLFARLDSTFIRLDLEKNRADQKRLKSDVRFYGRERERYGDLVKSRTAAQSTLDSHERDHATALQQLKGLQIEERRLEEQLRRHTLRGPEGWQVVERYIEPGEWVNTGEKVAELGRYDVLLVPFALSSTEYAALKALGDTVTLNLPDSHGTVQATLERVSPGFDPETRKINVDLQISSGDLPFRGGVRTELVLNLPDPGGSVLVPSSALVKAYEEYFLMTPDNERVRVVLLGSAPGGFVRVTSPDVRVGDRFLKFPEAASAK